MLLSRVENPLLEGNMVCAESEVSNVLLIIKQNRPSALY
jgi:hypothetical protein